MESKDIVYLCLNCNKPIFKDPRFKRLKSTRFHHGCGLKYEQTNEPNKCECGCGSKIPKLSKHRGETRRFKNGHHMKGEKNHNWTGDNATYHALHKWINSNLPKPELCEICNKRPHYDAANITGIYTRDFKNWKYVCRFCHWDLDRDKRVTKR